MQRENRYLVFKIKDAREYLDEQDKHLLDEIAQRLELARKAAGKRDLQCVVVEDDWPEYETVWKMIELRVRQESCKHEWAGVVCGDPTWCKWCGISGGPVLD